MLSFELSAFRPILSFFSFELGNRDYVSFELSAFRPILSFSVLNWESGIMWVLSFETTFGASQLSVFGVGCSKSYIFFETMLARAEGPKAPSPGQRPGFTMHNDGAPCKGKSIKSNNRKALKYNAFALTLTLQRIAARPHKSQKKRTLK